MGQVIQIDEARKDTRAGSYVRSLETRSGHLGLKVPKLRRQTLETVIIERNRRREISVEEALIEMYLAGVSVRRVEDITEALWGTRVSPSTVSNLNKKIYVRIEAWRNRPIEGEHPYGFLDSIVMKRTWGGEVRNVSLLVAIGVNAEGFREILGISEGAKEDKSGWSAFLRTWSTAGSRVSSRSPRTPAAVWSKASPSFSPPFSELGERLWADYQEFVSRDLGEYDIAYLFVDGHRRAWRRRTPHDDWCRNGPLRPLTVNLSALASPSPLSSTTGQSTGARSRSPP